MLSACGAPRKRSPRASSPISGRASSVPLHQLLHGRPEVRAGAVEVGMDGQRATAELRGLAVLAQRQVAERLAGQGPEVVPIACERLAAIVDGRGVALREVPYGRALVPAFRELGGDFDE